MQRALPISRGVVSIWFDSLQQRNSETCAGSTKSPLVYNIVCSPPVGGWRVEQTVFLTPASLSSGIEGKHACLPCEL